MPISPNPCAWKNVSRQISLHTSRLLKRNIALLLYQYYPHPFLIKQRPKALIYHQNRLFDVETIFCNIFLSSELQCLPRVDLRNLCANTRIRLLTTQSLWCLQRAYIESERKSGVSPWQNSRSTSPSPSSPTPHLPPTPLWFRSTFILGQANKRHDL